MANEHLEKDARFISLRDASRRRYEEYKKTERFHEGLQQRLEDTLQGAQKHLALFEPFEAHVENIRTRILDWESVRFPALGPEAGTQYVVQFMDTYTKREQTYRAAKQAVASFERWADAVDARKAEYADVARQLWQAGTVWGTHLLYMRANNDLLRHMVQSAGRKA